jgi:hypothetical protein
LSDEVEVSSADEILAAATVVRQRSERHRLAMQRLDEWREQHDRLEREWTTAGGELQEAQRELARLAKRYAQ